MKYTVIIRGSYPEPWQSCPVFETAAKALAHAEKMAKLMDDIKIEVYNLGDMILSIDNSKK